MPIVLLVGRIARGGHAVAILKGLHDCSVESVDGRQHCWHNIALESITTEYVTEIRRIRDHIVS